MDRGPIVPFQKSLFCPLQTNPPLQARPDLFRVVGESGVARLAAVRDGFLSCSKTGLGVIGVGRSIFCLGCKRLEPPSPHDQGAVLQAVGGENVFGLLQLGDLKLSKLGQGSVCPRQESVRPSCRQQKLNLCLVFRESGQSTERRPAPRLRRLELLRHGRRPLRWPEAAEEALKQDVSFKRRLGVQSGTRRLFGVVGGLDVREEAK
mmetsp:Transcript_26377/g.88674  ORF Transcript_26377/g.88674 Transcript_26377/m.88674 type:complete len:206 (-) Transcript_26377:1212-1829(-)